MIDYFVYDCLVDMTKITLHVNSSKDNSKSGELKISLNGVIERQKKRSAGKFQIAFSRNAIRLSQIFGQIMRNKYKVSQ